MKIHLVVVLWMITAVCCVAYDCPKQCKCGKTVQCSLRNLAILKRILPTNITRLDLSSAGIRKIPPGAFENFTSLRYLSLANNSIAFLPRHSFKGLHNLRELNLQNNGQLKLSEDFDKSLPSLKTLRLDANTADNLPEGLLNSTHTVNVSIDRRKENVHCDFYKRPREECTELSYPICTEIMDIKEDLIKHSPFPKHSCVLASCENKQRKHKVVCLASKTMANSTCWPGMIGENTGVKLALWTFGLLAVTSNLLVLVTLICNSQVRRSALCIFIMNLLLGNILIGVHIVIVTVSDTVTYGESSKCHQERWEAKLCVPLFIVKNIGLIVVVLSLALLTIERFVVIILKLPRLIDTCRAIGYVFESWILAAIATVVLWTKAGNWGYLCSTFSGSKYFADISKGINLTLVGICFTLICFHIFILCWTKLNDHELIEAVDYRNTIRTFLLVLSTFLTWAVPYILFLLRVSGIFTEEIATQTMAISLSLNACLHTFLYAFDNDHLANLYNTLSCRQEEDKEKTLKSEKCEKIRKDIEMGQLTTQKSPASLSLVSVKPPETTDDSLNVLSSTELNQCPAATERRGSELTKAEGAVIITNKSPTNPSHGEATVLLHSPPSSPTTSTRCNRAPDEGVSECGTISSDTNVTWLSSECPSVSPNSPNTLLKLNDGNSTLSSMVSSIAPSKSPSNASTLQRPKRRFNFVGKEGKRRLSKGGMDTSLDHCDDEVIKAEENKDENQNTKRERRMSPVRDIIVRVLSPKVKKRPKTLDCVPTTLDDSNDVVLPPHKRAKSLLEGKEAENMQVSHCTTNPLRPLSPVRLRDKRSPPESTKDKRNGVLVFRAGSDGLEIHEDATSPTLSRSAMCAEHTSPKSSSKAKDWERLATFLVIKPVSPRSKIKISDKDKKKGRHSLPDTVIKCPDRVRIFENPAINLERETVFPAQPCSPTSPLSPTRHLAKQEEGDKLAELPLGLKQKNRVSTASTASRVSKTSLEWDNSDSYKYGDEDVMPPPPPPSPPPIPDLPPTPQPSPGPERKAESADHVECVQVRLDPANRYSLEWDPTGVQMRLSVISQDSLVDGSKSPSFLRQKPEPEYV